VFLTGVAYDDTMATTSTPWARAWRACPSPWAAQSALSAAAGGYQIALPPGTVVEIRVTGGLDAVVTIALAGGNANSTSWTGHGSLASADMTLVSGLADARLLGVADLDLTGNDAATA
jgi:hypothetical protein